MKKAIKFVKKIKRIQKKAKIVLKNTKENKETSR